LFKETIVFVEKGNYHAHEKYSLYFSNVLYVLFFISNTVAERLANLQWGLLMEQGRGTSVLFDELGDGVFFFPNRRIGT
jgi:hypothetical protein